MIAAVLLLAVGALAAAAAHVSTSGVARGDIALVNPVPDRSTSVTPPEIRTVAPLFAGSLAARTSAIQTDAAGAFASRASASARQFELVSRTGFGNPSSYRNFAGERRNRGNSGGSNGSGGFSAGGMSGGGGFGGVSGTARRGNETAATGTRPTRPATAPRQSSGSRPGIGSGSGGGGVVLPGPGGEILPGNVVLPGGVIATAGALSNSPGTSSTPEPLTLLLVGSGLVGLYGARKHLAG